MTEYEKMRSEMLYSFNDPETIKSNQRANELCLRLSQMTLNSPDYRATIEALIPGIPKSSSVNPPFHCDHGHGIHIGEDTFINYDAVILDAGNVYIGSRCKIGPRCQIYTPQHPIDHTTRNLGVETAYTTTIGDDCWLGGGVIVCPGVTIGARSVIAAGSVVIRDIPEDSVAAGNPAVVKRTIGKDKQ